MVLLYPVAFSPILFSSFPKLLDCCLQKLVSHFISCHKLVLNGPGNEGRERHLAIVRV
jgi:hypothetical protein